MKAKVFKGEIEPKFLTRDEAKNLINRVKLNLKKSKTTRRRREEPGLTEQARHVVIKF